MITLRFKGLIGWTRTRKHLENKLNIRHFAESNAVKKLCSCLRAIACTSPVNYFYRCWPLWYIIQLTARDVLPWTDVKYYKQLLFINVFLCTLQRKPSVLEAHCFRVCPSVSRRLWTSLWTTYITRAHHGWDTRTWRDVSSYLFTYLPRNYDTPV